MKKVFNVFGIILAVIFSLVLIPIGLIAAVFSTTGNFLGAGLTIKNGSRIVRPVILTVLVLLAAKILLELFGIM